MQRLALYKTFFLGAVLATIAGCNENQEAEKIGEKPNVVKEVANSSGQLSQSSSAVAVQNSWLSVQEQEYGDSGVVVRLRASVSGEAADLVQWQQISGPAIPIINANQLNAEVLMPQVSAPTTMTFQVVATRAGQNLTATQTVVALPLPEQATIASPVLSAQNQSVTLTLNNAVDSGAVLPITVMGGTAV